MKKFLLNLLALGFFLVSCNPMSENKLVVVTCADNPPFEYIKKGEIVGFDIDLIKEIGRKLGKEVEIQNIDFSGLILALMNNRVEVAIAALSPTPARAKYVDFTKSYMEADMAALFRDNLNIQNEDDLKSKILGAQFGSTWADYAR
ncbi:MAG: ABC transporter substrate-binding protein, partial [Rickettsiaceae bacterium]|nr:ABC transporter substrate-binding protein [Rickettsiaceae bacterium]